MIKDTVTFEVNVYRKSRGFNFPKHQRVELGIKGNDSVHLTIRNKAQDILFQGRKTLKSGNEIYGKDISYALVPGATILIQASEPYRLEAAVEAQNFDIQELYAGFQTNPKIRSIVEKYAMQRAQSELKALGFKNFKDTSKQACYDYTCRREGTLYYVEVKGTQGSGKSVILTRNEVRHAQKYSKHSIAIVVYGIQVDLTSAEMSPSGGSLRIYSPWRLVQDSLKPLQYHWRCSTSYYPHQVDVSNVS